MELTEEDLLISVKNREGFVAASDYGITVVLDTRLTPELILEGTARELVSKLQTMRKDAGFEVTDRIRVAYRAEGDALKVLSEMSEEVAEDVLADCVEPGDSGEYTREWDINGDKVTLSVSRVGK